MHFIDLKIDIIVRLLFNGKKVVRFFHGIYRPNPKSLKHRLRKLLWRNNKLVGVSESVASDLKRLFPKFHTTAIVNAIDFDSLETTEKFPKNNAVTLIMMGWDKERKGVDLALKAVERLQGTHNLILQIVAASNKEEIEKFIVETIGSNKNFSKL